MPAAMSPGATLKHHPIRGPFNLYLSVSERRPFSGALAGLVAFVFLAGGGWLAFAVANGETPPTAAVSVTSSPNGGTAPSGAPSYHLTFDLRHVTGRHTFPGPAPAARLRSASETVSQVVTELYSIGFVDAERWQDGRFGGIYDLFALRTRGRVRRDLSELTLGPLARRLEAVRPRASILDIRFLVDRFPIVAVATVSFRGTALVGDAELPVRHDGEYTLHRVDQRWRIASYHVRSRLPSDGLIDREIRSASASPGLRSTGPNFVLVIGSDARPGRVPSGARADSLHIVGVNPSRGVVSILGIPRDSYVPIPGVGVRKINESLLRGGPDLVVRTLERLSGVSIDGYVLTGFGGLRNLVNAIGGITIDVPYAMRDPYSGARFRPGVTHLSGREALAFARDRHDVPGGDFGRSLNQGRLLVAALRELKRDIARDPAALFSWIAAGSRILRTDLSLSEIVDLLLSVPSIDPGRVQNRVVPGSVATVGGLSVVRLGDAARTLFHDLAVDADFDRR